MSARKETHWEDSRNRLNKARTNGKRSKVKVDRTKYRQGHSQEDRKPTPLYLPRLQTPPEHEICQNSADLRQPKYRRVPPLDLHGFHSNSDQSESEDESDVSEYEDDSYHRNQHHGNQVVYPAVYPYPLPGYPVAYQTTPLVYPQGSFVIASPEKQSKKPKKKVRYADYPIYLGGKTPTMHSGSSQYSRPPDLAYINNQPMRRGVYQTVNYPQDIGPDLLSEAALQFRNYSTFAEDYVDFFIEDYLQSELIPNVLIELLTNEIREQREDRLTSKSLPFDILNQLIKEQIPAEVRDVVAIVTTEMVDELLENKEVLTPEEEVTMDIVMETVSQIIPDLVKNTLHGLVDTYLLESDLNAVAMVIIDDVISSDFHPVATEVINEAQELSWLTNQVIIPVIKDGCQLVAMETLKDAEEKHTKHQVKQLLQHSKGKLLESICFDALLLKVARQGKVWVKTEVADVSLESMMFSVLLQQVQDVEKSKSRTKENQPLNKLHSQMFSDVMLEGVISGLSRSLDEDMADWDEHEQGLWNPTLESIPDWAIRIT